MPTNSPSQLPSNAPTYRCNLTPEDRAKQILDMAISVSGIDAFSDSTSARARAVEWLVGMDDAYLCPDDGKFLVQRYVMAVFYFEFDGDDWNDCSAVSGARCQSDKGFPLIPFLDPSSECDWGGLECNVDGCITKIRLDENNLIGELPPELSFLTFLSIVDLDDNNISGPIPNSYGDLQYLKVFDVDENELTGTIPDSMYDNPNLRILDLNGNQLSGSISPNIGNAVGLQFVQLYDNQLTGTVPASVSNLPNLHTFSIQNNQLVGTMPQPICDNRSINGGTIGVLWADCGGNSPLITCALGSCCSHCRNPTP